MSEQSAAREEILGRISAALLDSTSVRIADYRSIPRAYRSVGELSAEACLDLFVDRLVDYGAEVIQVPSEIELPAAIAQALHSSHESFVVVPEAFPQAWLPASCHVKRDRGLSTAEIDRAETVVTTCKSAVAATGTIVLVHEGDDGRRVLTLLPDHHICLVHRGQIVEVLPEALKTIYAQSHFPITTISGPSATSDSEMTRIRGVHGPRRLTVVIFGQF